MLVTFKFNSHRKDENKKKNIKTFSCFLYYFLLLEQCETQAERKRLYTQRMWREIEMWRRNSKKIVL